MEFTDSDEMSIDLGGHQSATKSTFDMTDNGESLSTGSIMKLTNSTLLDHMEHQSSNLKENELNFLYQCRDAGVVHILGDTITKARKDSGLLKRIAIDYIYAFLKKICVENSVMFHVPHESMLSVGQIFSV